jgi:hypothetical protein
MTNQRVNNLITSLLCGISAFAFSLIFNIIKAITHFDLF